MSIGVVLVGWSFGYCWETQFTANSLLLRFLSSSFRLSFCNVPCNFLRFFQLYLPLVFTEIKIYLKDLNWWRLRQPWQNCQPWICPSLCQMLGAWPVCDLALSALFLRPTLLSMCPIYHLYVSVFSNITNRVVQVHSTSSGIWCSIWFELFL